MNQRNIYKILSIIVACLFILFILIFRSKEDNKTIVFASSSALSGPLKGIGQQYSNGIKTYFNYINDLGGIKSYKIDFLLMDDQYEPLIANKNISSVINSKENIFGIIGTVGTPTSEEALKLAIKSNIPFLMPFTGAEFLYSGEFKNLFTLRPSYRDEANEMVKYFLEKNIKEIAVFYQNDSYGLSALRGIEQAIKDTDIKIKSEGIYNRNTISIHSAFQEIQKSNPQAVVMAGAYKPTIEFINKAINNGFNWEFVNFSFVGLEQLTSSLSHTKTKILIAQVVPPITIRSQISSEYIDLFKKYYPDEQPNSTSFEGFWVAKIIVKALQQSTSLTKDDFVDSLEHIDFKPFEDSYIKYSPKNHNGLKKVYLIKINGIK